MDEEVKVTGGGKGTAATVAYIGEPLNTAPTDGTCQRLPLARLQVERRVPVSA